MGIPEEPMYLLMNVAMSSTWGFVSPPPPGCGPNGVPCFDCGRPACLCACSPNLCDNFPAHMLIDSVRIYQSEDASSEHIVGCSPDSKPTATYIKGHQSFYMNDPPMPGETMPLKPVADGGGFCRTSSDCGNSTDDDNELPSKGGAKMSIAAQLGKHHHSHHSKSRGGFCANKKCVCGHGWTGPNCLAAVGYDDVIYNNNDDDVDIYQPIGFDLTPGLLITFMTYVIGIGGCAYWKYLDRLERQQRKR